MPIVTIDVIKNVFSDDEKAQMIKKVTETMIEVEGEGARGVTWVKIHEVCENDWAIGGHLLDAEAVNRKTGRKHRLPTVA